VGRVIIPINVAAFESVKRAGMDLLADHRDHASRVPYVIPTRRCALQKPVPTGRKNRALEQEPLQIRAS